MSDDEQPGRAIVRLAWSLPRTYLRRAIERLRRRSDYPLSLIALEIRGNLAGPWALWQARRKVRRFGPSEPYIARSRRAPLAAATEVRESRAAATTRDQSHAVSLESPLS